MTADEIRIKAALSNLEEGRITVRVGETFQFDGPVLDYRFLVSYSKVVKELLSDFDSLELAQRGEHELRDKRLAGKLLHAYKLDQENFPAKADAERWEVIKELNPERWEARKT